MVIGTHALISETVAFQNLGLVITDEQHRFGVAQRSLLAEKAIILICWLCPLHQFPGHWH